MKDKNHLGDLVKREILGLCHGRDPDLRRDDLAVVAVADISGPALAAGFSAMIFDAVGGRVAVQVLAASLL